VHLTRFYLTEANNGRLAIHPIQSHPIPFHPDLIGDLGLQIVFMGERGGIDKSRDCVWAGGDGVCGSGYQKVFELNSKLKGRLWCFGLCTVYASTLYDARWE
jgi:hypothetical protein